MDRRGAGPMDASVFGRGAGEARDRKPGEDQHQEEDVDALEGDPEGAEQGLEDDDVLTLRRIVGADGRGRAFVNDQPASVALLRIDGRAVAAQVLMYCGTTAYTWKTAFDADYAKYSLGALLIDKVTEELFDGPLIETIDSCSVESGFMAQLWAGRRAMVDLLIDARPGTSIHLALEAWRLRGYRQLRDLRDRFRASRWAPRARKAGVVSQN